MVSLLSSKPFVRVQRGEFVVGLEGAVLVGGGAPGDVDGAGDVATLLCLFLRQVGRGEDLAGELVGGTHVDEILGTDRVDDLVAEGADRRCPVPVPCIRLRAG